jgi:hypothetical protein
MTLALFCFLTKHMALGSVIEITEQEFRSSSKRKTKEITTDIRSTDHSTRHKARPTQSFLLNVRGNTYVFELVLALVHLILPLLTCDFLSVCHTQVIQFLEAPEYSMFSRIVFDTAPTVMTISL